jgi:hypothetical protein
MWGEYKILLPFYEQKAWHENPKGGRAIAHRRNWKNLISTCKNLKRNKIPYEVEYHLGAKVPYALIFAGKAVRQQNLQFAKAA